MSTGLAINRKLQLFEIRVPVGYGLYALLAVCLLLWFTALAPASISVPTPPTKDKHSEKKRETPLPPQPVAVAVQVTNGGTVQIPLRIYGRQEQTTGFLIRKGPTLGKIVSLEPVEAEVWLLTYQHTSAMTGESSVEDHILFAAQNKNGTSSAAEILLTIVDNPPILAVPDALEFGEIAASQPAVRSVSISNQGGGVLEGIVTADVPWTVEPSGYRLHRGETAQLRVSLLPETEREYKGKLHFFAGETKVEPTLHATAFVPFTAEPAMLELGQAPERSGTLSLTNRTVTELTLALDADPRLHLPSLIVLAPKQTQGVRVALAPDDPSGIAASVRFSMGSMSRQVQVNAASGAPQLRVEPAALAFGKVENGAAKSLALSLVNRGGADAAVHVKIAPPFRADSASLVVKAGKSAQLMVTLDAQTPGPVSGGVSLEGVGPAIEVALSAEVVPSRKISLPVSLEKNLPRGKDSADSIESKPDTLPPEFSAILNNAAGGLGNLPPITGLKISHVTLGSAEIGWDAPKNSSAALNYRVDVRRISLDAKGQLVQNWIPVPDVQFANKSGIITALLTGIPYGINVTARIVALTSGGEPCAASLPLHFYAPAPQPLFTLRTGLLTGFTLLLAGAFFAKWWQTRR